jgi:hypothetical protein
MFFKKRDNHHPALSLFFFAFYLIGGTAIIFSIQQYRLAARDISGAAVCSGETTPRRNEPDRGFSYYPENENRFLPLGYDENRFIIEKTGDTICQIDADCVTPAEYLIRSNCPYFSKCLNGYCSVVCPLHKNDRR